MRRSRFPGILALVAIVLVAGACSNDSAADESGVASLESESGTPLGDAAAAETLDDASQDVDPEEAALEFSACMREEGLEFPDLGVDADGRLNLRSGFEGLDPRSDEFRSAMDVCQPIIESAGFGAGGRAAIGENVEIQDALVEFSACVRDGGYDVGDLSLGGPGPGNEPPADGGEGDEPRGQGQGQGGFGDRSARIADQLGLDVEDPQVSAVIDGCMPIIDEAFTAAGIGQG